MALCTRARERSQLRGLLFGWVDPRRLYIHAVPTADLSPEQAAAAYERTLKAFYGSDAIVSTRPLFDVTLLGIGEDGHTASPFRGHPALEEERHWALAVIGAKSEARITLTYPAVDSSREAAFLVTGASKREQASGSKQAGGHRARPIG